MTGYERFDPTRRRRPVSALIRDATRDDLDALADFQLSAVNRTRDDWATMIDKAQSDDRALLVAEVDGAVGGFGQAHFLPEHPADKAPAGFYLTGVTVLPAHRRGGIGEQLTTARLAWAKERAGVAWYFAASANLVSIDLHTRFGFAEVLRAPRIHGVSFESGEGVLFRANLSTG